MRLQVVMEDQIRNWDDIVITGTKGVLFAANKGITLTSHLEQP
jgi:hypothetical protein